MAGARFSFEERKAALKWYFKFENISEVQRQWRNEFGTQPPTKTKTKLRGLSPHANYTDRAAAAGRRS